MRTEHQVQMVVPAPAGLTPACVGGATGAAGCDERWQRSNRNAGRADSTSLVLSSGSALTDTQEAELNLFTGFYDGV